LDTGLLIALLNPTIALALGAAFLVLWSYQRHRPYLAVLAVSYSLSAVGFLLQYFTLPIGMPLTKLASNICFTIAGCCLSSAIVHRYGRKVPYVGIGVLAGGGLASLCWFLFVAPDLTWRILAMNFAFGGISLLVAAELRPVRNNGPTEKILFVLSLLSGLNFFVRTLVVVMKALKTETYTDPLSGLLNRRGFEERGMLLLRHCASARFPVALVLADLDHFKALNDVHGHAAGDRVIADFAAKLRSAAGARGVAGRVGGEEFAVLLPLSDLAAARLFAEAVRTLYSAGHVDGLPAGTKVTASFGVAARSGDEALEPLMRRADDALYKAKRNGRDSVRLSYERPETAFVPEPLKTG